MFIKILILTSSCASDGWYVQRERERVIRLSPEEREEIRQRCKHCWHSIYKEPTPEELERLNDNSLKSKIRNLYYGI